MVRNPIYLAILFLILLRLNLYTQNQNAKWYFGVGAAIDLMPNPPVALFNSVMTAATGGGGAHNEGCSSIADASGNLLLYTNGVTVYNKAHQVMANGTGLFGGVGSTQAALIVRQPGSLTHYYIFTTDEAGLGNGLRYSVVDLSLAAGMGSVTAKNIQMSPANSTEKLCATRHCNGTDMWILSHDSPGTNFRAHLLTANGISPTQVVSNVGTNIVVPANTNGAMKVSPTGKKIGLGIHSLLNYAVYTGAFELYDFDNATGVVSNSLSLGTTFLTAYGCEFSPDGTKFYGTPRDGSQIFQWDLCAGSPGAIVASQQTLSALHTGQMQLAPNGKIYVAAVHQNSVSVINNPNALGNAANYVYGALSLGTKTCSEGITNLVYQRPPPPPFTYSFSCSSVSFAAIPTPTIPSTACGYSGYSLTGMSWDFDDPGSLTANTSTLSSPVHAYPAAGTYSVRLVYYYDCGGTDTLRQTLSIGSVSLSSSSGFSICSGQSATLTATGAVSYTWSTGHTTPTIAVTPMVNTTYTVEATDSFGCRNVFIQTLTVNALPANVAITGDSVLCSGSTVILTATGSAATYSWSGGTAASTIAASPVVTTTYSVIGASPAGCTVTAVKTLTVLPKPMPVIAGNSSVCAGSGLTLTASGANSYSWNTGALSPVIQLTPTALNSTVVVTSINNYGCTGSDTRIIYAELAPNITLGGDTTACLGSSVTKSAGGAFSFTWSTGATSSTVNLSPVTSANYTITGSSPLGCKSTRTFSILVKPVPQLAVNSVTVCSGIPATLIASAAPANNVTYTWYPGPLTGSMVSVISSTDQSYSVTANYEGCLTTRVTTVTILPSPSLTILADTAIAEGASTTMSVSGGSDYTWDPPDHLSCSHCPGPISTLFETTRYCVSSELESCLGKACTTIYVSCEFAGDLSVPNAFTPNRDGINDEFCLQGWTDCISDFKITIFDRWGERVFVSGEADFCWNGAYEGKLLDNQVLIYVITATKKSGRVHKKGNISLIR